MRRAMIWCRVFMALALVLVCVSGGVSERVSEGVGRRLRGKSSRSAVVILFDGSQGSSYFLELLAQLQSVCVVGYEPLSEVQRSSNTMSVSVSVGGGTSSTVLHTLHTLLYPTTSFEDYKAKVVGLMDSQEHFSKCTGSETVFALKARLSATVVEKVMKDPAFSTTRFVLLRRNYVKQAVATLRRKECGLGQFNLRIKVENRHTEEEILKFKEQKCTIRPTALTALLTHYAHQSENLSLLGRKPTHSHRKFLEIHYEDIVSNATTVVDTLVAPFLGISTTRKPVHSPTTLQKASPELLCHSLLNYKEVCSAVRSGLASRFVDMFNEDSCGSGAVSARMREPCCPHC